jgi:alkylated DNA nucleotide flippase Atl1
MASTRAQEVAEVLWELKRADKVATYSAIARRAGFSAGTKGRTMKTCLKTVRRDWPHLQWWRAINDDQTVKKGGEQEERLKELGVALGEEADEGRVAVEVDEDLVMVWEEPEAEGEG